MAHAKAPAEAAPQTGTLTYLGAAHFVNDMLTGTLPGILPFIQSAFGLSYGGLGLLVTLSNLSSSVVQPLFGAIGDRRALTWLVPLGPALASLGLLVLGHAPTVGVVYGAVLLLGLGSAAFHPEGARAAHWAGGHRKGLAQGMFQVGGNLGFAFGPLMVPLFLDRTGLAGLSWLLLPGGVMTALGVSFLRRITANRDRAGDVPGEEGRRPSPSPFALEPQLTVPLAALMVVIALRSFVQLGVASFLPLDFVRVRHQSAALGATMAFVFLAAGAVGTYCGGWLSDRTGAVPIVRASMAASVPLMAVMPDLSGGWLVADLLLLGFVVLSTFAVTVTLGQSYMPGSLGVSAGLTIGLSVGTGGLGTALLGAVADRTGVPFVLHLMWLLPVLAFGASLLLSPDPRRSGQETAPA